MKAYKKHQSISRIIEPKSSLGHQGSISNILHQYQKKAFPVNTQTIQRVVKVVTRVGDTPHDMTVQETISWLTGYFTIVNTTQLAGFLSSYDKIYAINDNLSKECFKNDYISFIHNNKSYIKTGEDLIYGRRTITLEDSDGGSFDLQFKKAIGFIREAEKLSEQIARLLIYTKEAIKYDLNQRNATYTDITPLITDYSRKRFTGELGHLLAAKAMVCREKAAFGQILLSELGIDTIAVYGSNSTEAHAWLRMPDSGIEIDPTWGTCGPHPQYPKTENARGRGAITVAKYQIDTIEIARAISETQSILADQTKINDIRVALQGYLTNPGLPNLTQSKAEDLARRVIVPRIPARRVIVPRVPARRVMIPRVPVRRVVAPKF